MPATQRTVQEAALQANGILTEQQFRELEINNLRAALSAAGGRLFGPGGAVELLGVKPTTLASRLKKLVLPR